MITDNVAARAQAMRAALDEATVRRVLEALGVGKLRSYGAANWLISAPYREDRRPSCSVQRASGLWNDKTTGERGSLFDLIMATRGCDLADALRLVEQCGGRQPSPPAPLSHANGRGGGTHEQGATVPSSAPLSHSHGRGDGGEGCPGEGCPAAYPYHDEQGTLLYTVQRTADKRFFPVQPDGQLGYGARRVLYRLPELLAAGPDSYVQLCEGEKDADAARALGLTATTSPGGANAWRAEYAAALAGRRVAIIPDNDEPGWRYAQAVAADLAGVAAELKIVVLPDLGERTAAHGKDLSDWLALGHDDFALLRLIGQTPAYQPSLDPDEQPWPARRALCTNAGGPAPLDPTLIPEPLRAWLTDIAARLCVPLETVAAPAIVGLPAVVGRQLAIRPRRHDPYTVVPNLWGMDIGTPSEMKSARALLALAPVFDLERRAHEEFQARRPTEHVQRLTLESQETDARRELAQVIKTPGSARLLELQGTLEDLMQRLENSTQHERRYLVQDPTVAKLGNLLRHNPRGLLLYRNELSGWLSTVSANDRSDNRGFYLESWNGTGPFTVDRMGRDTDRIPAVCLSIYGTIQPHALERHMTRQLKDGATDGFLQRFQLMLWCEPTAWHDVDRRLDPAAYQRALRVYETLDQLDPAVLGAATSPGELPFLRFAPEAQARFDRWRDTLERRLRGQELRVTPAFEAHLGKYRSLLPSLALLFHLAAWADDPATVEPAAAGVSDAALSLALSWAELLEQHARKVYQAETEREQRAALALAERIDDGDVPDGMRLRDLRTRRWPGLRDRADLDQAVQRLEALGWLRVEERKPATGRPSRVLRLHPELRG